MYFLFHVLIEQSFHVYFKNFLYLAGSITLIADFVVEWLQTVTLTISVSDSGEISNLFSGIQLPSSLTILVHSTKVGY